MYPFKILEERREDFKRVYHVNRVSFGGDLEARLVDALRARQSTISLVAEVDRQIVGHVFFSPVRIDGPARAIRAMGLAPLAVLPEFRKKGIGTALVEEGVERCRLAGNSLVFVVGDPAFYRRLGFTMAAPLDLHYDEPVYDDFLMVKELLAGALRDVHGCVRYAPEFLGL